MLQAFVVGLLFLWAAAYLGTHEAHKYHRHTGGLSREEHRRKLKQRSLLEDTHFTDEDIAA